MLVSGERLRNRSKNRRGTAPSAGFSCEVRILRPITFFVPLIISLSNPIDQNDGAAPPHATIPWRPFGSGRCRDRVRGHGVLASLRHHFLTGLRLPNRYSSTLPQHALQPGLRNRAWATCHRRGAGFTAEARSGQRVSVTYSFQPERLVDCSRRRFLHRHLPPLLPFYAIPAPFSTILPIKSPPSQPRGRSARVLNNAPGRVHRRLPCSALRLLSDAAKGATAMTHAATTLPVNSSRW